MGSENQLLKIPNYLKTPPASFSPSTECLPSPLHPERLSEGVGNQQLQQHSAQSVAETVTVSASPGELAKAAIPI